MMAKKKNKQSQGSPNSKQNDGKKQKLDEGNPFENPQKDKEKSKKVDLKSNKLFVIVASLLGLLIIIALIASLFFGDEVTDFFSKDSCNYNGITYMLDESFESTDGCNICVCVEGDVSCTESACEEPETPEQREFVDISKEPVYDPNDTTQYLNDSAVCSKDDYELYVTISSSLPKGVVLDLEEEYASESECVFEFVYLNSVLQLGLGVGSEAPFDVKETDQLTAVATSSMPDLQRLLIDDPEYAEISCSFFGLDPNGMCTWFKYGVVKSEGQEKLFYTGIKPSSDGVYGISDLVVSEQDKERAEEVIEVFDYVVKNSTLE